MLGAVLGQAAVDGRDKLTILADASVASLGAWLEQLVDESSGKQGKGILVVDGEPVAEPERYGADRIFVYLRQDGSLDAQVEKLHQAGHPVLVFEISDVYDLGAEFYRWEVATAFACAVLGVNAFDQPDVQDSKTRTVKKIEAYKQTGKLDEGQPIWKNAGMRAFSTMDLVGASLEQSLQAFLGLCASRKELCGHQRLPAAQSRHSRRADRIAPGHPRKDRLRHHGRVWPAFPAFHRPAAQRRAGYGPVPADHRRPGSLTWRFPRKR